MEIGSICFGFEFVGEVRYLLFVSSILTLTRDYSIKTSVADRIKNNAIKFSFNSMITGT